MCREGAGAVLLDSLLGERSLLQKGVDSLFAERVRAERESFTRGASLQL